MSVSHYVYCGPYIQCTKKYEIKKIEFNGCTNIECLRYRKQANTNFCSKCGNPIEKLFDTRNVQVSKKLDELFDVDTFCLIHDEILTCEYDILLPNLFPKNIDKKRQYYIKFKDSNCQNLTNLNISSEIDELAKFHVKEIEKLKNLYGEDQVKIFWGILTWADC